jgi:hypothetical protein
LPSRLLGGVLASAVLLSAVSSLALPVRWEFAGVISGSGADLDAEGERFSGSLLFDPELADPPHGGFDLPVPPSDLDLAVKEEAWDQSGSLTMSVGNDFVPYGETGVIDSIGIRALGSIAGRKGTLYVDLVDDSASMLQGSGLPTTPPSAHELSEATVSFLPLICTRCPSQGPDVYFQGEIDQLGVAPVPEPGAGALLVSAWMLTRLRRKGSEGPALSRRRATAR